MKTRRSGLMQRMMAVLLSAVLVTGMMWEAVPISVLAQESVSENTPEPEEGETEPAEEDKEPAEEDKEPAGETGSEEQEKDPEGQEPGEGAEQEKPQSGEGTEQETTQPDDGKEETQEPGKEEEKEQESVSENDAPAESVSENDASTKKPRRMMRAAADNIASGDGWVLAGDGTLMIESDDGMTDWISKRETYKAQVKSVEIKDGVKNIEDDAFKGCKGLTAITIPDSVTNIGEYAFYVCSGLVEITIPDSVTNIGECAFNGCSGLVKITIPNSVTSIGDATFQNCRALSSIAIPESVISIGAYAFIRCRSLTSITIPESVTSIERSAFASCSGLREITIPKNVMGIGVDAFRGCSELTAITVSGSETSIGTSAFAECSKLTDVTMKSATPPGLGDTVFYQCKFVLDGTKGIHVPGGRVNAYQTAWTVWRDYITDEAAPAAEHKHNDVTFTAWTKTDSLPETAGNYYLTKDVTLTSIWWAPNGTTNLCLNGKTVSGSSFYVIEIGGSKTLKLYDCQNAGKITGGRDNAVQISNNGTFHMYGGNISDSNWSGSRNANSSAVCVMSSTFHMYGGNISGNIGKGSGGVYIINSGTFKMYGGEISGNTATYSGGGVFVSQNCIFEMCGGEIVNNTMTSDIGNGGGVYTCENITVGGEAKITGNKKDGAEDNVYLAKNKTIAIDTDTPLTGSAQIGVTTKTVPTEGSPVDVTGHNKDDYSRYFTSDNSAYKIVNNNNVVQLTAPHTHKPVHHAAVSATCEKAGTGEYWKCEGTNGCNKMFSDQECTNELSTKPVLSALGHSYGSTWEKDANGHWHECSRCQEKTDQAKHTYDDDGDTDCNICGYQRTVHTHSLTRVDAKAATCTADGNKAYYVCGGNGGCGKWFLDEAGTQEITDKDSVKISKTGHSYDETTWGYKEKDGHAHICVNCDAHDEVQAHTPGAAATATTPQTCTLCGYIIAAALGHTCSPQPVAKKDATCTAAGKQAYYHCEGCGKNYEDAAGTKTIADISAWGTIAALGHDWGEWKVTKKATATKPGEKERTCKRCDEKETETIPATGGGSGGGGSQGGGNGGSGDNGGGNDQSGGSDGGSGENNGGVVHVRVESGSDKKSGGKDDEPKTGDATPIELVATLSMIAGFTYLLLYFADRRHGMTEETKKELVSRLVAWGKQGTRIRRYLALAAIFVLLVYYHSIGKKTCVEWKEIYGE